MFFQNSNSDRFMLGSGATQACVGTASDGSTLSISYLPDTNQIQYLANVTQNSYLAVGYGTDMTNTDMVSWIANAASSTQQDMYSVTEQAPTVLPINSYTTSSI